MKNLLLLLFGLLAFHLHAQKIKITAEWLFDGESMRKDGGVIVEGNQILEVGKISSLSSSVDSTIHFQGKTLMPGMIEGHSHVLLYPYNQTEWNDQVLKESRSLRAIRGAVMAERQLQAGFTSVRDLGSEGAAYADVAIKQSIELGIMPGPRMQVAGPAIVATGSYGPKGFHPDFKVPLGAQPADGSDLIRVTREQIGKGADFIKVYADYRWGPDGEARPTFTIEELKLIVETAESSGRVVVAHAATPEGMRRATLAGVKTIEHGTGATKEVLALMKENGVALCPTLGAVYSVAQYFDGWNPTEPEPERIQQLRSMFKLALESDVRIVAGGDVGVFPHGKNALELQLMNSYGMSEIAILTAVTASNAEILGFDRLGRLQHGFLADLVVVDGNPSKAIEQLYQVELVMKDGQFVNLER